MFELLHNTAKIGIFFNYPILFADYRIISKKINRF